MSFLGRKAAGEPSAVAGRSSRKYGATATLLATAMGFGVGALASWLSRRAVNRTPAPVAQTKLVPDPIANPLSFPDPPLSSEDRVIYEKLKEFAFGEEEELLFPEADARRRRRIHVLASLFRLKHTGVTCEPAGPAHQQGSLTSSPSLIQVDIDEQTGRVDLRAHEALQVRTVTLPTITKGSPQSNSDARVNDNADTKDDSEEPSGGVVLRCVKVWKPPGWPRVDRKGRRYGSKKSRRQQKKARKIPPPDPEWTTEHMRYYEVLKHFLVNSSDAIYDFPTDLTALQRKRVHDVADVLELDHRSKGRRGRNRFIRCTRVDARELAKRKEQQKLLDEALLAYKMQQLSDGAASDPDTDSDTTLSDHTSASRPASVLEQSFLSPGPGLPVHSFSCGDLADLALGPTSEEVAAKGTCSLRYVNWNVEWMDQYFESDTAFRSSIPDQDIADVSQVLHRIAGVARDMQADVLAVTEGPRSVQRMQLFVDVFLDGLYDCIGLDETSIELEATTHTWAQTQCLYFLVRRDGPLRNARVFTEAQHFLCQKWRLDVNGDCTLKEYNFTRVPLLLRGEVQVDNQTHNFYACVVHFKSKYISRGRRMWTSRYADERQKFVKKAVKNRRRITAECMQLRRCLDKFIYQHEENALVCVSGDMNDGPGMDFFEQYYLLTDSIDALLGSPFYQKKMLRALLISKRFVHPLDQWSICFEDFIDNVPNKRVLLDHIFVSYRLWESTRKAGIAHSVYAQHTNGESRQLRPSDHRPVYANFL